MPPEASTSAEFKIPFVRPFSLPALLRGSRFQGMVATRLTRTSDKQVYEKVPKTSTPTEILPCLARDPSDLHDSEEFAEIAAQSPRWRTVCQGLDDCRINESPNEADHESLEEG